MFEAMQFGPRFPLGVEETRDRGRGLVALADIPASATIETAPAQVLPAALAATINAYRLDYFVLWEDPDGTRTLALPLGLLGLCNYSDAPNAALIPDARHRLVHLVATRDIRAREEITIKYRDPTRFYSPSGT
jgi:SET domain